MEKEKLIKILEITKKQSERLEDFLKRTESCLEEGLPDSLKRISQKAECPFCHYFYLRRPGVNLPEGKSQNCLICGKPVYSTFFSSNPVHKSCALEHKLCSCCLSDIRLNTRRKSFPVLAGKTPLESETLIKENTRDTARRLKEFIRRAVEAVNDARREKRLKNFECRLCFYIDKERFSTESVKECLVCGEKIYEGRVCTRCAEEYALCKNCGADIELDVRIKKKSKLKSWRNKRRKRDAKEN